MMVCILTWNQDCVTTEGEDPVYPNAGPDVVYGDGMSSSSPPSPGTCDSPTPYGQTYRDLGDSSQPAAPSIASAHTPSDTSVAESSSTTTMPTTYPTFSYVPLPTTEVTSAPSSATVYPSPVGSVANQRQAGASQSYSTTTVTIDCPSTVTLTIYPSASTTSKITMKPSTSYYTTAAPASVCTGTSASCPCAMGYQCQELSSCTWACHARTNPTTLRSWTYSSRSAHSTVFITTTHTVTPVKPTGSSHLPNPSDHPPYATGDVERYLPCVPGTFICTSRTKWEICNYNDGSDRNAPSTAWVYGYPRYVSAGMECITFLSPYSSQTSRHPQQGLTPNGYFRDDRIVRARPDGDCDHNGSIKCTDNGAMFEVCDQGGWVNMGSVASGTTCSNGAIIASR
jgi:hypothetical protein